jgi:hypothetical protein
MREIKVYDESRRPREWNALLTPSECAVFFKHAESGVPLSAEGKPFLRFRDCTFLLFGSLEEAHRFCETKVQEHPDMCCEILDSKGRAQPPLLVIVHPSIAEKDEMSASSVRRRKVIAILLFIGALPLFWWDRRAGGALIWPTFLGIAMILAAIRFLHYNMARRDGLKEQEKRIHEHLQREKESTVNR